MKKVLFLLLILSSALLTANSNKPQPVFNRDIREINCADDYLSERKVMLGFNLEQNRLEISVNVTAQFSYLIEKDDLIILKQAIEKAEEWYKISKQNHLQKVIKPIPIKMQANAFLKLPDWKDYGKVDLQFDFLITEHQGRIKYFFVLGMEDRNLMKEYFFDPFILVDLKNIAPFKYAASIERFNREIESQKKQEDLLK